MDHCARHTTVPQLDANGSNDQVMPAGDCPRIVRHQRQSRQARPSFVGRVSSLAIALLSLACFSAIVIARDAPPSDSGVVVLLHGLARTSSSMSRLARSLQAAGYRVCNLTYPSRKHSIEKLTTEFVAPGVRACVSGTTLPVNFVTHSLGGIIVRQLATSAPDIKIGRVVMLSPPNHGSEVVDKLGGLFLFR